MTIIVESDVPYAGTRRGFVYREPDGPRTMPRKWPWTQLRPGDSFVVPSAKEAKAAYNSYHHHKGTKYSRIQPDWFVRMRRQPDGTYRLWLLDKNNL